jgi:hypothetical protein
MKIDPKVAMHIRLSARFAFDVAKEKYREGLEVGVRGPVWLSTMRDAWIAYAEINRAWGELWDR